MCIPTFLRPWLAGVTAFGLLGAGHAAATNLLPNGGFETSAGPKAIPAGGWWVYEKTGTPRVTVDARVARTGKASARLEGAAGDRFTLVSPKHPVVPGDRLRYECFFRWETAAAAAAPLKASVAYRSENSSVFGRVFFELPDASTGWTSLATNLVVPEAAVSVEVHFSYVGVSNRVWVDDARLEQVNPVSLTLAARPRPWVGRQELLLRLTNHQAAAFEGKLEARIGRQPSTFAVALKPRSSQVVPVPVATDHVGNYNYVFTVREAAGAVVTDLDGRFRTEPALRLYPACPYYHQVGENKGLTRLDVAVALEPARRQGLRLTVSLTDASGHEVRTAAAETSTNDTAGLYLCVPVQAEGDYTATARLLDAAGRELGRDDTPIRVRAAGQSHVTTGRDGFLRAGGKPFFPVGMFSCGRYDEMGAAGFSGTHNYGVCAGEARLAINPHDVALQRLLDQSWSNGLRMMVELPREAVEERQWAQVRRRIETFRHHPGLLCWGSEERVARGEAPLRNIEELYRLVRQLDPHHPFVLGDTRDNIRNLMQDRRRFFPDACMDAGIWWWYPIPLGGSTGDGDMVDAAKRQGLLLEPPSWLTTTLSKKPLWIAIQSYRHPRADARFPTPAEYRAMAYLSIINGVKSLWFYTGYGQRDHLGRPAGLLNCPEEGRWDYVKQLAGELRELSPVLLAPVVKGRVSLEPANAPVEFTVRRFEGRLYLLAVNKSDQPKTVRFVGKALRGKSVKVLHENHPANIQNDALADAFGSFASRVYQIE